MSGGDPLGVHRSVRDVLDASPPGERDLTTDMQAPATPFYSAFFELRSGGRYEPPPDPYEGLGPRFAPPVDPRQLDSRPAPDHPVHPATDRGGPTPPVPYDPTLTPRPAALWASVDPADGPGGVRDPADGPAIRAGEPPATWGGPASDARAATTHGWDDPDRTWTPPTRPYDIDPGTVLTSALGTIAFGVGVAAGAGALVAAGVVTAPFVLIVGGVALGFGAVVAFGQRTNAGFDADADLGEGFVASAVTASLGDAVGLTNILEGWSGRDAVTDHRLPSDDRSERLGRGVGGIVGAALGRPAFRFGRAGGAAAARAGYVDPYTIPSFSRPSHVNPVLWGGFRSPAGAVYRRGGDWNPWGKDYGLNHLLRHTKDEPGRLDWGRPGKHGVFDPRFDSMIRLVDDAILRARAGDVSAGVQPQPLKDRTAYVLIKEAAGTQLGHPSRRGYGMTLNYYTVVLQNQNSHVVTAFPGVPVGWGDAW